MRGGAQALSFHTASAKLASMDTPASDDEHKLMMTESTRQDLLRLGLGPDFEVGDEKIEVVPDIEAREMTVICEVGEKSRWFADDVVAKCDRCGVTVHHRPHVPMGAIIVCMFCYRKELAEKGLEDPLRKMTKRPPGFF